MKLALDIPVDPESQARGHCRLTAIFQEMHHPEHTTPAQFLLRHGKLFTTRQTTRAHGLPQACYQNAYRLARKRKGYRYVEGFATGAIISVEHAWCLDRAA